MIDYLGQLDTNTFLFLNNLGNTNWDWLWLFITDKWSSIPLYLFLLFLLYKKTGKRSTLLTLGLIILLIAFSDQFSNFLKGSFQRLRPCQMDYPDRSVAPCGLWGFPSAHAFSSMALAIFMGKILKPFYRYALPGLVVWSLALGFSRIYLGVHYPGDVAVGFSLGVLVGFGFFYLRRKLVCMLKCKINHCPLLLPKALDKGICESPFLRYQCLMRWFLLFLVGVFYFYTEFNPENFILEDTAYEVYYETAAMVISLLGFALRMFALGYRFQQEQISYFHAHPNASGIYSMMRHPLIVGNFLICMGPVFWTGNLTFMTLFFVIYWIYFSEVIVLKEQYLREKYGKDFDYWMAKTPSFFPRLSNYRKPRHPFNWKLFFLKELKFVFYLLLIYCLFHFSAVLIKNTYDNFNYFLMISSLLVGAILFLAYTFKNQISRLFVEQHQE